jgi:hypothetical protein
MVQRNAKRGIQERKAAVQERLPLYPRQAWGELLRQLEVEGIAPPRSTFYVWANEADKLRSTAPTWTLAEDRTGNPRVVLDVMAALHEASNGRLACVTVDEAAWIVKLDAARPTLRDEPHPFGRPVLNLYFGALRFLRTEPGALDLELALGTNR